jgi:hypothetical protein
VTAAAACVVRSASMHANRYVDDEARDPGGGGQHEAEALELPSAGGCCTRCLVLWSVSCWTMCLKGCEFCAVVMMSTFCDVLCAGCVLCSFLLRYVYECVRGCGMCCLLLILRVWQRWLCG